MPVFRVPKPKKKVKPAPHRLQRGQPPKRKTRPKRTPQERFNKHWVGEPNTGCWLWTGAVDCGGYGEFHDGRSRTSVSKAHRASWEMARGPIPDGMFIDHICRVRSCVNPDHLRVVTPRTNTLENSNGLAARHLAKPNCPRCGAAYRSRVVKGRVGRWCAVCVNSRKRKRIPQRNAGRRAEEFARCFHSRARVEWVKSLSCAVTGVRGDIDNAHVCDDGTKGVGRRSGYACIVPMAREAHRLLHRDPAKFFASFCISPTTLANAAAYYETLWQLRLSAGATDAPSTGAT